MLNITGIPAFNDNYIWCLEDTAAGTALIVDPGQAEPVIRHLDAKGLTLDTILVTHHHPDHVGGIAALTHHYPLANITGPATSPYKGITSAVSAGDRVQWHGLEFLVFEVPGHTLDHIAFYSETNVNERPVLFCGDTLFICGCGRLFEGTAGQMRASLATLRSLPDSTAVYCAHEYTLANLRYARHLLPADSNLEQFEAHCESLRNQGMPTVPGNLGNEKRINPFLRWDDPAVIAAATGYARSHNLPVNDEDAIFAAIRHGKDHF